MPTHCRSIAKAVVAAAACLASGIAAADAVETGRITNIFVEGANLISIELDGTDATSECGGGGRWTIVVPTPGVAPPDGDVLAQQKLAALLAAAAGGQLVTLVKLSAMGCGTYNSNPVYYVRVQY